MPPPPLKGGWRRNSSRTSVVVGTRLGVDVPGCIVDVVVVKVNLVDVKSVVCAVVASDS